MTAEARLEVDADGRVRGEFAGSAAEGVAMLASFAEKIADAEGSRPVQVLQRAQSRAARSNGGGYTVIEERGR